MMQDLIIQDGVQYGGTYGGEWFPVAVLMIGTCVICRLKSIFMQNKKSHGGQPEMMQDLIIQDGVQYGGTVQKVYL